ncbi:restriction endonuclease subunit S [Clostridium sp. LBM24168]
MSKREYEVTQLKGIPENWNIYRLKDLGKTYPGLSGKNKDDFGKGKPYIPYKNIFNNSKIDTNYLEYVTISDNEKQYSAKYGDIFFTISSEIPGEVGMSSVLLEDIKRELYLNSFCFGYRLNNFKILCPEYAAYLFRGNNVRVTIGRLAQGSTRFNISKNDILQLKVAVPPLKEQKKIISILSSVDDEIEIVDKIIDKTKELKKGLVQKLLSRGIGHKNFKITEFGEIPENWEIRKLGDICYFRQGFQISRKDQITEQKKGYVRYLYITDFFSNRNRLYVKDNKRFYHIAYEDIVVANTGNTCGKVFKGGNGVLSNNMFKIFNNRDILDRSYMWQYLNSLFYWRQLSKYFNSAGQPHVGHRNMSELKIALPNNVEEQREIASILFSVDEDISRYTIKKQKFQQLKKGLMQKLLTGKIRVKE